MHQATLGDSIAVPAEIGGTDQKLATSRRAVITALALSPVLAVPALAEGPREWDRLLAAYRRARAACDAHDVAKVNPAWERMRAAMGPVPSMEIAIDCANGEVLKFQLPRSDLHKFDAVPWIAPHAAKVRDRSLAYDAALDAAEARENWSVIEAESSRLGIALYDALDELMSALAPDAAAFCTKFVILRDEENDSGKWDEIMLAEAKKFALS